MMLTSPLRTALVVLATLCLAACGSESTPTTSADPVSTGNDTAADNSRSGAPLQTPAAPVGSGLYAGDIVYGDPQAPVEIIEYASMTCPHCANFSATIYPKIAEKYVDTGKVKFVFRNFVSNQLDLAATIAARCGGEAPAGELIKAIFARQREWARSDDPVSALASIIRKAGISRVQFDKCLADREIHKDLVKVTQDAVQIHKVNATPTLIVDGRKLDTYGFDRVEEVLASK